MKRRRGTGSTSTVQTVLSIAFLLAVLIVIAILLTPDRDEAPPTTHIAYESRPAGRESDPLPPKRRGGASAPTAEVAPDTVAQTPAETPPDTPAEPEAIYAITGAILDAKTREPVPGVRVLASRIPTEAEEASYKERDLQIVAEQKSEEFSALIDEKQRLWADASANSEPGGTFRIPITHEGDYKITVRPRNHLPKVIEKSFVGERRPKWDLEITLEVGASVAGRITDSFDNRGISGIRVNATLESDYLTNDAQTDENGYYTIGGLAPGSYSVIADIDRTPYRVTKVLPFRRASITSPAQELKNIDFKLDKGGVVWGYVTTPENEPVSAHVVLCTSESFVSQALSALVRRAPPLTDNSSKEDGYYELIGVPLNEEWRIYATSDEQAPQLADPFIVTPRNKEVRVDITVFDGSNVFGQVVDHKGKPVPDARVSCFPSYGELLAPLDRPQAAREEKSDEEGRFELQELPAGNYQVMAFKEGYKFALNGTPLYANGYHDVKNFRVVLEGIESGKYRVFGYVIDATGQAVSEARVTLSGLGTESLNGVDRETATDSGGEFNFDGVEIGTYVLNADKDGYSRKTLGRVLLDEPNEIVLQAASIVRGRVLAKATNQAPENGYTVGAQKTGGESDEESRNGLFSFLDSGGPLGHSAQFQDPQGNYELTLSAGAWLLEGSAGTLTPARKTITLQAGEVLENIDLILASEGGTIEGRLVITDGQSPQGATVSLVEASTAAQAVTQFAQDGEGPRSMQVADDGLFSFDQLPEGTYFAVARHPAYPQAMSPAVLLEDQATASGVDILMGPGGSMEGYVFDNGRPASGWIVTVIANGQPYTGTTDLRGAYAIRNIPEGNFQAFPSNPSAGISMDAFQTQGDPVTIWSGAITYKNFGEFKDIKVNVAVVRGAATPQLFPNLENAGGRIVLNPGGAAPVTGSGIPDNAIPGVAYTLISQSVTMDVPIGEWRVDYYAPDSLGTYTWRGAQDFVITGEETEEVDVVIYAN